MFLGPLLLQVWDAGELRAAASNRQLYRLTQPLVYLSAIGGEILVPSGFETDFASIPRAAWSLLSPEDPCLLYPSVVHDFLYSREAEGFTRAVADDILREAMRSCGAQAWKIAVVFRAVRLFGGARFRAL